MLAALTPPQQINPKGPLFLTTTKNVEELQTDDIAYISCEFSDYSDGDIDPGTIINAVLNNQASAIVPYSIFADNCLFNPKKAFQTSLIYSMQNASSSLAIVDDLQKSIPPNPPASIFANQSSSAGGASTGGASTGGAPTGKSVIGIIIGIVIPILLVTMGLACFCIVRKRRRKRDGAAIALQDTEGEGGNPQLYFQQKAELDDEQRRHEMEAAEVRYEMDGEDAIHEMPVEERERRFGRQELRGEENSQELDNTL